MPTKKQRHLTYIYLEDFFLSGYVYILEETWSAMLLYASGNGNHQHRQQLAG